ncbi:DUF1349 domain-containing protein [Persicobacter diffluens]|uniref:DUF1349 domain-containing protein n=1 Tax=Persicobacter diffluens TaxID=981 RepID=A0AAN4VVK1_9BACT|nr:hypothetical protein PEDI_06460 [Persicobacter diffluens]
MQYLPIILSLLLLSPLESLAQKLTSMQWLNEPEAWEIEDGRLIMQVTGQSDYWNKSHYGFMVNDGPFLYTERGGEFEVTLKITGEYETRFDQMGLMFKIDENHWIKTGIEFVDGVYNFSTVHTIEKSSWSVVPLNEKPASIWIKATRKRDAIEIFYSMDGKKFTMSNTAYFPEYKDVKVGMMAASPDGNGFKAIFEAFKIKHLPDERRLEWLQQNAE